MSYTLTYEQLRSDLCDAYLLARRHKSRKFYVKEYESDLDANLDRLTLRLWNRTYKPLPSDCFAIDSREIYAAQFEDRIVHHLYFMCTHTLFERTFIRDSYSCIKGRGIHDGVYRYWEHIRKESRDFTRKCFALTFDIRGYFMHIDRRRLCDTVLASLEKQRYRRIKKHLAVLWDDVLDFDFLRYLTEVFCLHDTMEDKIIKGSIAALHALPKRKRLRFSPTGSGIPIGNLTSQLFSNIFLNLLDQFVKRNLKARHYCRYVDDGRIVSSSLAYLRYCLRELKTFLCSIGLTLQMTKVRISDAFKGTSFCGAFVMPFRKYISNSTKRKMTSKVRATVASFNSEDIGLLRLVNSLQSFVGTLSHYRTFNVQMEIFGNLT